MCSNSEQIYALLDDVESAEEDEIDNLMNGPDNEFIAKEEITQGTSTQGTSLTTPEANLHVVQVTISQKRRKRTKKKNYGSKTKQ